MSDTPRTDAAYDKYWDIGSLSDFADFARQMERELAAAKAECEREMMRLVACGVVALANTPESAKHARDMHEEYSSASCDDVARMVDREMALRAENAELKALLSRCFPIVQWADAVIPDGENLVERIRAKIGEDRLPPKKVVECIALSGEDRCQACGVKWEDHGERCSGSAKIGE